MQFDLFAAKRGREHQMSKQESVAENLKHFNSPVPAAAAASGVSGELPESLRTPEGQAVINATVAEAVKSIFASLAPMLQSMALTPEKIAEAEKMRRAKPPEEIARELRERRLMQQDLAEAEEQKKALQSSCPHSYPTGQLAWHVVRNFPDRQPRFSCPLCSLWCTPREWRIGTPDAENPRGRAFIAEEHPLYRDASRILASKGA
jgi:hypothetical protein